VAESIALFVEDAGNIHWPFVGQDMKDKMMSAFEAPVARLNVVFQLPNARMIPKSGEGVEKMGNIAISLISGPFDGGVVPDIVKIAFRGRA
jgi:hypothetical protein